MEPGEWKYLNFSAGVKTVYIRVGNSTYNLLVREVHAELYSRGADPSRCVDPVKQKEIGDEILLGAYLEIGEVDFSEQKLWAYFENRKAKRTAGQ